MGDIYNTIESRKDDLSVAGNNLQLPMVDGGGGYVGMGADAMNRPSPPLALFYPQLGYEIHPFLLSQHHAHARHQNMGGFEEGDDVNLLENDHAVFGTPNLLEDPLRQKLPNKLPKRKPIDTQPYPVNMVDQPDTNPDYAMKNRKIFFCKLCEKTFKFQTSLLRHNNKVHISKYQCQTCHRVFSRQAYLDVHTSKQGSSCYLGNYSNAKPRSKLNKQPQPQQ